MNPDDGDLATTTEDATTVAAGGDDAGFDDGFDNPRVPTATPESEAATQAEVVAPAVEYAQWTRAEYEDFKAFRASQERSFGTAFGKIGGIERTLQQFQKSAAPIKQASIDAMRADGFEDHAAALEWIRDLTVVQAGASTDPAQIEELLQQRIAPAVAAIEQKVELRLLAKEHPDYKAIDADPAFTQWIAAQPEAFRQSLAEASQAYDSEVVGAAMTKFKAARKAAASTKRHSDDTHSDRQSLINAAVTPRGTGATPAANTEDDFDAGFKQR